MVHWAQYMDIFPTDDQIGLIDFDGNPRPAWWAFKWFADLPVERVVSPLACFPTVASSRLCSALQTLGFWGS